MENFVNGLMAWIARFEIYYSYIHYPHTNPPYVDVTISIALFVLTFFFFPKVKKTAADK